MKIQVALDPSLQRRLRKSRWGLPLLWQRLFPGSAVTAGAGSH
jgi:hypothetical protein